MKTKIRKLGFTLIELMVVVAIIGILAGIALPSYHNYIIKSQMLEGLVFASELKSKIKEFYQEKGYFPANNEMAGLPPKDLLIGNYISQVEIENGAMHITYGNKINQFLKGKILTIRPQYVENSPLSPISWICGKDKVVDKMTAAGINRTNMDNQYLPSRCR